MSTRDDVLAIWPEIQWITDSEMRDKVIDAWTYAIDTSVLSAKDLETVPFSLLIKDCNVSFINHKRTCVQLAVDIAKKLQKNFVDEIEINMDILITGAILIDIGKLFEYEIENGKLSTSSAGKLVRHPFSGVAIAARFDLPAEVLHIIATHSKEGDLGKRSVESIIVHHADFVSFEPFKI
jgi:putative nucleotidyltransferase with HDIG domain